MNLPARLQGRYDDILSNTEISSLRGQIALLLTLQESKFDDLADERSAENWNQALKLFEASQADASKARTVPIDSPERFQLLQGSKAKLDQLHELLRSGKKCIQAEGEIREMSQEVGKLVSIEQNRLAKLQNTMTVEQVMVLIAQLSTIVKNHVQDTIARDAIGRELILALNQEAG